mgnify:CR=1 FL=1
MKHRLAPTLCAAALALSVGTSCASEPDSALGTFTGAWSECWTDSGEVLGGAFLNVDHDDPYDRPDGWADQGDNPSRAASRLFLDSGDHSDLRIRRSNPRREENSARSFFHWILDVEPRSGI